MPRKKSTFYRPSISKEDRAVIYRFTDGTCYYCGKDLPNPKVWDVDPMWVDHMVPLSRKGDPFDYDNQVPSCSDCNRLKHTRTPGEFKEFIGAMVFDKLWEALELVEVQERYNAPEELISALKEAIDKAFDAALDVRSELNSALFPGEEKVKEFNRKRNEWWEKRQQESGREQRPPAEPAECGCR